MTILVDGRSYTISANYHSIDETARMLSCPRAYIEEAIRLGQISLEKRGNRSMIRSDFIERLVFGAYDEIQLG